MSVEQIIPPQHLSTATDIVYTVPADKSTVVSRITFTNTSANNVSIDVHYIPPSGGVNNSNKIIDELFLAAGEALAPPELEAHVLPAGSTIRMSASAGGAITVVGSGTEI